ncbi:hypothetical protein PoB_007177100, partial [Plakobranchus ocellatus]
MNLRNGKKVERPLNVDGYTSYQGHYEPLLIPLRNKRELKGLGLLEEGLVKEQYRQPDKPPQGLEQPWLLQLNEEKCQAVLPKGQCQKKKMADSNHCRWHDVRFRSQRSTNLINEIEARRQHHRQRMVDRRREERERVRRRRRVSL